MRLTDAGLASALPLAVVAPIAGAVLSPLLARIHRRLPLFGALAALAGSALVLLLAAPRVFEGRLLTHFLGDWIPVGGQVLGVAVTADPLGLLFALATTLVGGVLLVATLAELGGLGEREIGWYACLFQLLLAALIGSALTADAINLFVWFEVAALASYGLTGFFLERPIALEATFKILVLTTVAGFAVFVGVTVLYRGTGAVNFGGLHDALAGHPPGAAGLVALTLLLAGFATKAGLLPFHGWLPDAHTAAPGPVSALFSGLMVNLGIVAIVRLAFQVYDPGRVPVLGVLMVLGLVSAVLGAVLALGQDDLKRLLAYDTVSQMGVLATGYATGSPAGVAGATYHLLSHALFKSLLFLCAGAIVHGTGATRLSRMGGLARRNPVVAAGFILGVASIAGVPGFNGYVSLSLIHHGLEDRHEYAALVLLLAAQAITVAALAKATWFAFFAPHTGDDYERDEGLRPDMMAALGALGAGCLAFGVLAEPVLNRLAAPAAAGLLAPAAYARTSLGVPTRLPDLPVPFDYAEPSQLATVAVTALAGLLLARAYGRGEPEPAGVRVLRAAHTGSVNDYAAYAVAGLLFVAVALRVG